MVVQMTTSSFFQVTVPAPNAQKDGLCFGVTVTDGEVDAHMTAPAAEFFFGQPERVLWDAVDEAGGSVTALDPTDVAS